jgi:hypothetical protein
LTIAWGETIFGYISSRTDNSTNNNLNLLEVVMKKFPEGGFAGLQGNFLPFEGHFIMLWMEPKQRR